MSRYGNATFHEVRNSTKGALKGVKILGVAMHIMDGYLMGSESWFDNPKASASAHFGVGRGLQGRTDGEVRQWVDTDDKAWAQKAGNDNYLSIENEGFHLGKSSHSEDGEGLNRLTPAQIESCAQILAWASKEYGFKLQLAKEDGDEGLAYHSLSRLWGHPDCPGPEIISQLPEVVLRAKAINGVVIPKPSKPKLPEFVHALRRGDKTNGVKLIQRLLGIKDDGVFGPKTESAVRAFQKKKGLAVDGIVGPKTWAALSG